MFGLVFLFLCCLTQLYAYKVDFDSRAFTIDGKRQLLVAGSVHYPRASSAEWPHILSEAKANGINLIEMYVFWSIHEPTTPGEYYFPSDGSNSDIVEFIRECDRQGLLVNLRFGPYTCAEWNFGGFPVWLKGLDNITFRTMDNQWLQAMSSFIQATVKVVDDAKLFARDSGPIIMAQVENEYGNLESFYGESGEKYVQWAADLADSMALDIPWIMCQQGEGVGTAPPAHIVNTCNGYYCDNWIEQHTKDFPNQPHMFTENWPGWFQVWGQPVPHRPAVDVAFSVARWFAKGGTYMNYYMAFGGTTFGRQVGGPLIITSYDYDVQINEYGMRAEPKFSLTRKLHDVLLDAADVLLAPESLPLPAAVPLDGSSDCESHTYSSNGKCYQFLSNYGVSSSCSFPRNGHKEQVFDVPAWSVSIAVGDSVDGECRHTRVLMNTKSSLQSDETIPATNYQSLNALDIPFTLVDSFGEPTPYQNKNADARTRTIAPAPIEQLNLTRDTTDYLWYSVNMSVPNGVSSGEISFESGAAGGATVFAFVNGVLSGSSLGADGAPVVVKKNTDLYPVRSVAHQFSVKIPSSCDTTTCQLDLLSVNMGIQNYGPFLESVSTGIISNIEWSTGGEQQTLSPVTHTVGLMGEVKNIAKGSTIASNIDTNSVVSQLKEQKVETKVPLQWYSLTFPSPEGDATTPLALQLISDEGAMYKGAVWVNGRMLGRYWGAEARNTDTRQACDTSCVKKQADYVGSYSPERCVSGCGAPSQSFYKLPYDWLNANGENSLVVFEEVGGVPSNIKLGRVVMEQYS